MTNLKNEISEILKDLKENHNVVSVKSEFETEGLSYEETDYLKHIAKENGLNYTIKLGGYSSINDIRYTKKIEADALVAPMVESKYALKKFYDSVKTVYESNLPKLYINIETISGFNAIDEIIQIPEFKHISGIVLGRSDMIKSMDLTEKNINSDEIRNIASILSNKAKNNSKEFAIGGCITQNSFNFLKSVNLTSFETRKIIFNNKELEKSNTDGILKAIKFEILWLKHKTEIFGKLSDYEEKRITLLESRNFK